MRKPTSVRTRKLEDRSFATAVKVQLAEKNKTLSGVAEEMGVPHPRVRQWLGRNLFPVDGLIRLAAAVGLSTNVEELKRSYGVRITTHGKLKPGTPSIAETIRYYLPEHSSEDFGADVKRFLLSMAEGETFIVWSIDELPFELRNVGWAAVGNAIAAAIYKKKIFCIYVHPDDDELRRLREKCGLRKLPHADFFVSAFEQYKRNLSLINELRDLNTDEVLLEENGAKARLSNRQINEHVIRVSTRNAAFCSPHHRYVVFIPPGNATRKPPSALAQFPSGDLKTVRPSLLPLAEETTFELYDFLMSCLKAEGAHRESEIVRALAPVPTTDSTAGKP